MRWISATALLGPALAALACLSPATARGAGGPVPPVQGGNGISVPGIPFRYVALAGGHDTTVVKRLGTDGTGAAIRVPGRYGIPGADYSGSTTGLSADGNTLVLAQLTGYTRPRTTRLLVFDTPELALRTRITLPGWSTVDAISPSGRWLYLIHYGSTNVLDYSVLAYDLVAHRMLSKPIVDPHDRGEAMVGFPLSRVMSGDGRWAYTLYDRPSDVPFVHALDTVGRRAVCIDLPSLGGIDLSNVRLRLGPGGGTLRIEGGVVQAVIDTRTFVVHKGAFAPTLVSTVLPVARGSGTGGGGGGGGVPWDLVAVAAALAVLGGAVMLRTRLTTG